jgi:putative membrane protein
MDHYPSSEVIVINENYRTCLQLLVAFAIALKHRLRFEPYVEYDDMRDYVGHLETWSKEANKDADLKPRKYSKWKHFGEFLGLTFAESNPRKDIKRADKPLGNLPLEILGHLEAFVDTVVDNGTLKSPVFANPVINGITMLNDILGGTERILHTPLPLAYRIVISQITWVYVLALPLQLYNLEWKMIPATLATAYIILGLALIGSHIENPFGHDVNDLPLDTYCEQIAHDIDVISSSPAPKTGSFTRRGMNKPLWPLSQSGYEVWADRGENQVREALRMKVKIRHDQHKIHAESTGAKKKKADEEG